VISNHSLAKISSRGGPALHRPPQADTTSIEPFDPGR
jgi:hypothetical protein